MTMMPIHSLGESGERRLGLDDALQAVLDTLRAHIAILDKRGTILAVNQAWCDFALANGLAPESCGLGSNYLSVCDAAEGETVALAVAQGIRDVLEGSRDSYANEYCCAGPQHEYWFRLVVQPVTLDDTRQVVVAHEDITESRQLLAAYQHTHADLLKRQDRLQAQNRYLQDDLQSRHGFEEIVGRSAPLMSLLKLVEQVAPTDATVLIAGETGTGKELIAHAVHRHSRRQDQPLITVNCAALPATLIESELFGHEKGAFTGALNRKVGRFELADGGTLFLDEIGELPLELQAKLLRVLQSGEFERLGSATTHQADVRVIAATNRKLAELVESGDFREDLYYRLNVFPLLVPAMRERREDIPLLVWGYLTQNQGRLGRVIDEVSAEAMASLMGYRWPGNVRELHNVLERSMILSPGTTLVMEEVFGLSAMLRSPVGGGEKLVDMERSHIESVLESCNWRIKGEGQAAERLGLNPSTLWSRMKKLGISRS